jgi:DNA-binding PadR family transcriptional regulator
MTIYELGKAFKASLGLFYSASLGSLQVAVRKLRAKGFIAMEEIRQGKRVRKVYTLLEAGRQSFFGEMAGPIPDSKLEITSLARLHFMGLLHTTEERSMVKSIIVGAIESALSGLLETKAGLDRLPIPAEYRPVFHYQAKTLEYGIMSHRAALEWFRSMELEPPPIS